jgi:hypothetical protein
MINQTVPDALSVNIRTYVIGAPGSEPARAFLSQIAWAGGTARDPSCTHTATPDDVGDCHFDMTDPNLDFATALNDALQKISGKALSCELDVPKAVGSEVDYDKVNVTFTPGMGAAVDLFQDSADCATAANGWQYNADKTKIVLCGDACKMVKSDVRARSPSRSGAARRSCNEDGDDGWTIGIRRRAPRARRGRLRRRGRGLDHGHQHRERWRRREHGRRGRRERRPRRAIDHEQQQHEHVELGQRRRRRVHAGRDAALLHRAFRHRGGRHLQGRHEDVRGRRLCLRRLRR